MDQQTPNTALAVAFSRDYALNGRQIDSKLSLTARSAYTEGKCVERSIALRDAGIQYRKRPQLEWTLGGLARPDDRADQVFCNQRSCL